MFFANSSETIQVQARLIPEVAKVIAKVYTDMTKLNMPIASWPTLFATYMLKISPAPRIKSEDEVKIIPFTIKIFAFLKIIHQ